MAPGILPTVLVDRPGITIRLRHYFGVLMGMPGDSWRLPIGWENAGGGIFLVAGSWTSRVAMGRIPGSVCGVCWWSSKIKFVPASVACGGLCPARLRQVIVIII